jgi:hypothetical protein
MEGVVGGNYFPAEFMERKANNGIRRVYSPSKFWNIAAANSSGEETNNNLPVSHVFFTRLLCFNSLEFARCFYLHCPHIGPL